MSKANETNDPKARAIDALRRAGWPKTAGRVERGESSLDDALRELRALKWPDSSEVNARVVLEALVAAERSAQTDLAHATVTIAELRAHYDALRAHIATLTAERDSVREQLRQAHAVCAGAPNESAVEAVQRTRDRCAALEAELAAERTARNAAQATLDESLSIQSQIWDAVGGQREGESLVDAVRRVVRQRDEIVNSYNRAQEWLSKLVDAARLRDGEDLLEAVQRLVASSKPCGLPKPERIDVKQWWQVDGSTAEHANPFRIERVLVKCAAGYSDTGAMHIGEIDKMLTDPRWRYLGNGERPIETIEGCGYCGDANCNEVPAKEASVGKLDGVLSEAAKRYAETPDHLKSDDVKRRRAAFDARVEAMVDNARAQVSLADIGDGAVLAAEAEYQRAIDEAREAGRAEAKAEIEERDLAVWRAFAGIRGQAHGDIVFAAEQVSRRFFEEQARAKKAQAEIERLLVERDAAYRRGQEEMRERAAIDVDAPLTRFVTTGELAARVRPLSIANAPTASASEGPGEAGPGCGGTETAGAGESVARESAGASREPRMGDLVEYIDDGSNPAIVLDVYSNGEVKLREFHTLVVHFGVKRGTGPGTWRFRD